MRSRAGVGQSVKRVGRRPRNPGQFGDRATHSPPKMEDKRNNGGRTAFGIGFFRDLRLLIATPPVEVSALATTAVPIAIRVDRPRRLCFHSAFQPLSAAMFGKRGLRRSSKQALNDGEEIGQHQRKPVRVAGLAVLIRLLKCHTAECLEQL